MLYDMTHARDRRSRAPGTKTMRPEIDSSFVGRSRELDRFRAALDAAMDGQRQILLLSGEPGIGKTRCAEMFARVAEDCGALALWGRCYEEPGAPPYWPWVQILREYVRSSSESELQLMTGARVQDMAAILPDLFGAPMSGCPRSPEAITCDSARSTRSRSSSRTPRAACRSCSSSTTCIGRTRRRCRFSSF